MDRLAALLSKLTDSLRLFMVLELQPLPNGFNVIIYSDDRTDVEDFEIFKWQTEREKADVLRLIIRWLLKKANESEFLTAADRTQTQTLLATDKGVRRWTTSEL